MINITCPICKNSNILNQNLLTIKKNTNACYIKECSNCKHIFTFFDWEVDLNQYYDGNDYIVRDTKKTIFYFIQKLEYQKVINQIKKYTDRKKISLLDFGSGKGLFLNFAKSSGFEVKGVETSIPRANYAINTFNVEVDTNSYFAGKVFTKSFDVITFFHVLEHLDMPCELLKNLINDNLNVNGMVVIEVPNFNSWQSKWSGEHWLHLDVPRHLNHFTSIKIEEIILQLNLLVIKKEYFSLHHGVIGMIQTIWSWFGYKGFLIGQLKEDKSLKTLFKIGIVLPFAFILELISCIFQSGGILRYYIKNNS